MSTRGYVELLLDYLSYKFPLTNYLVTPPQESFFKLAFHLVMFFFYLYSMIVALIKDEAH